VILHGLAFDDFILVVVFESQWILGIRTFLTGFFDFRKCFLSFFRHTILLIINSLQTLFLDPRKRHRKPK